ncbi:hypothetical protein [Pelagibacterium luteolum]|nr:hypothetical protein [Pelagibacterium luteolum]
MDSGIPFVFVTGYEASEIPDAYSEVPMFQKPVATSEVAETLLAGGV